MPGSFTPPTIQGAIKRQTDNYNFVIPVFDAPGWGSAIERNFDVIDSVLYTVTGLSNVRGPWENSTLYHVADRVVDIVDDTLWQCYVEHTSNASDSFEDDRIAHPTYWRSVVNGTVPRGDWTTATNYNSGEIVTDGGRTGVVADTYTSGVSYNADVTAGHMVTIVDVSAFTSFDTAIISADNKVTLANNDLFGIVDSADSNELKNHTWAQVKAGVKTYADTLYQPASDVLTATTASFLLADETKLDGIETGAQVTSAARIATAAAATANAAITDNDRFVLLDSSNSLDLRYSLWSAIKTALNSFFNGLGSLTIAAGDLLYGSGASTLSKLAKGTAGQVLAMNAGATAPEWVTAAASSITLGTPATASGNTVDFTSIPAGVKNIKVMFSGVSIGNAGTAGEFGIQIGDSGGIETSGYAGAGKSEINATASNVNVFITSLAAGFMVPCRDATDTVSGSFDLSLIDATTNTWICEGSFAAAVNPTYFSISGGKSLTGVLDRVRFNALAASGFDAGKINIWYA